MRVPWTARRSSQSILKDVNPEYSLEGLMLKLKLQYFGHLMRRADSLEKTLILGRIEGRKRRGQKRMRWLDGIFDLMDMSLSKFREMVKDRDAWCAVVHVVAKSQTQLSKLNNSTFRLRFSPSPLFKMLLCSPASLSSCSISPLQLCSPSNTPHNYYVYYCLLSASPNGISAS